MHLYLIGAAIAAAVVFAAGYRTGASHAQAELDALRAAYTQAALRAEQDARETEARHARAMDELARAARDQARAAAAARQRADAAAVRLRDAAARAGAECAAPPAATADGGQTAAGPGLVLSDLLGRCGARLVELGDYADRAAAAGAACERAYDAVMGAGK
jgi:hypothetical protein